MIAKVLRGGSGFSGVIEYLYEGKLENRKAEDKRAEVILHSDNLRVPRDWQDAAGRQRMKADFIEQAKSHRHHKPGDKAIGEHVLSFSQDDMRKLRTKEGLRQVASEYVQLLGLDKTQHVAILHQDTDHPHLHVLFNRITDDRKKYNNSWEKKRAVGAAVALAQKHGLHLVGELSQQAKEPRARAMRAGMEDLKLMQQQHPILSQARNLRHFEKLADKQGVSYEKKVDQVKIEGTEYRLGDLEAMFQANRAAASKTKPAAATEKEYTVQREELLSANGMAHFKAKARRLGVALDMGGDYITFNGEKHAIRELEERFARNLEDGLQKGREHTREFEASGVEAKAELIVRPTGETPVDYKAKQETEELFEALSLSHFEYTAERLGIPVEIGGQTIGFNGEQYARGELEAQFARNLAESEKALGQPPEGEIGPEPKAGPEVDELFSSTDLPAFLRMSERLGLSVEADQQSVTVGGARYERQELEEIFNLNRAEQKKGPASENSADLNQERERAGSGRELRGQSQQDTTDKEHSRKSGVSSGITAEQTQQAQRSNEAKPQRRKRKKGKKIPDFRQKIEQQERYRSQGQKL